jgi:predicted RNA binding protein YcfA (HicA-like mRNA interferase family)
MSDMSKLVKEALRQGWVEVTGKGHRKFRCPCGAHSVTVSLSPSEYRGSKNARRYFTQCPLWRS